MSFGRSQFVKWSFPAFALILGLFWYKRRRVDRVDPGGPKKISPAGDQNLIKEKSEIVTPSSLCDSGIHTDESFNNLNVSSSASTPVEETIISPRKVSENLDIPTRKSSSTGSESRTWFSDEIENIPTATAQLLPANPKPNSFSNKFGSCKSKNSSVTKIPPNLEDTVLEEKFIKTSKMVDNNRQADQVCPKETDKTEKTTVQELQTNISEIKQQGQVVSERDSANHSPVSAVMEGSVNDEARSEGSTDSGKGGSIKGVAKVCEPDVTYNFCVPIHLVGKLIGKGGYFLLRLRHTANVTVVVTPHPSDRNLKVCSLTGSHEAISIALDLIRASFPQKHFPNLTLEPLILYPLSKLLPEITWAPEVQTLHLIDGVNNDVLVCGIVAPNHLFLQIPGHPTYPAIAYLEEKMTEFYETVESPLAPEQLWNGMILVGKMFERWVRICIEDPTPNGYETRARLVDHGSYWVFNNLQLRKIHSHFLEMPFQAIEVFIANIEPKNGTWSDEACEIVKQVSLGQIAQAQTEGYIDDHVFISLYYNIYGHGVISLADELIARGFALPFSLKDATTQDVVPVG